MSVDLHAHVPADGALELRWSSGDALAFAVLFVRTGVTPTHTSWMLGGQTRSFTLTRLSRHQRYRVAVLALDAGGAVASPWMEITPRVGLAPRLGDGPAEVPAAVGRISSLTVMPQDRRLTAYWRRTPGFCDGTRVQLLRDGEVAGDWRLEPEVRSLSIDARRGAELRNGTAYAVRVYATFAGAAYGDPYGDDQGVTVVPAPQGTERAANGALPQRGLVYPTLSLAPEVQVFADGDGESVGPPRPPARVLCGHCRREVHWASYQLRCPGCAAEFIPNGRGDFLEVAGLRFGTCACCLPRRILVRRAGAEDLTCAHSGKVHIAVGPSGERRPEHLLIEDLPFGLCQCCRPRRPLTRSPDGVACADSGAVHHDHGGVWVLAQDAPVFDAAAIDDLLDAGLAEICSTGVSRAAR